MAVKRIFILASTLSMALTTGAFAAHSDAAQVTHKMAHRHHVAKNVDPNRASDANQDMGTDAAKPATDPEYFGHAAGSDGSMPQ